MTTSTVKGSGEQVQSRSLAVAADAAFNASLQAKMVAAATSARAVLLKELLDNLGHSGFPTADQNTMFTNITTAMGTVFAAW